MCCAAHRHLRLLLPCPPFTCLACCCHCPTGLQGQQKEAEKKRMGMADKAMYVFGQLVFGSQPARLATFTYLLFLHLLVFACLMRMTHHSSGQLYEHTQAVMDNRHDVTAALHHAEVKVVGAGAGGAEGLPLDTSRLP